MGTAARRRRRPARPAPVLVIRHEAATGEASRALFAEYMDLVARAARRRVRADRARSSPPRTTSTARAPRGWSATTATRRWRAAACAGSRPASPRSSGCSSPRRPAAAATPARCWPSSSGWPRRTAASGCASTRPRSCARRARSTARAATARRGRRDRRARRPVAGEGDHARLTHARTRSTRALVER